MQGKYEDHSDDPPPTDILEFCSRIEQMYK